MLFKGSVPISLLNRSYLCTGLGHTLGRCYLPVDILDIYINKRRSLQWKQSKHNGEECISGYKNSSYCSGSLNQEVRWSNDSSWIWVVKRYNETIDGNEKLKKSMQKYISERGLLINLYLLLSYNTQWWAGRKASNKKWGGLYLWDHWGHSSWTKSYFQREGCSAKSSKRPTAIDKHIRQRVYKWYFLEFGILDETPPDAVNQFVWPLILSFVKR